MQRAETSAGEPSHIADQSKPSPVVTEEKSVEKPAPAATPAPLPVPRVAPATETKAASVSVVAVRQQSHRPPLMLARAQKVAAARANVASQAEANAPGQPAPKLSVQEKPGSIIISGPQTVHTRKLRAKEGKSGLHWFLWVMAVVLAGSGIALAVPATRNRLRELGTELCIRIPKLFRKKEDEGFEDGKLMLSSPNRTAVRKDDTIEDTVLEA